MRLLTQSDPGFAQLYEPCEAVTDRATEVLPFLRDMWRILHKQEALGLAAPQVGIRKQFFVYASHILVVNPKILWFSPECATETEGCLSFPDQFVPVYRSIAVKVVYDLNRGTLARLLAGREARVFQHEFDHLHGITIMDRVHLPRVRMQHG